MSEALINCQRGAAPTLRGESDFTAAILAERIRFYQNFQLQAIFWLLFCCQKSNFELPPNGGIFIQILN